jgi:hypothetical protein
MKKIHILARIRKEFGITQAETKEKLGLSLDTLKSIGRKEKPLRFTESLALRVSNATGISVTCLLANDSRKPLIGNDGRRWTIEHYAEWWANKQAIAAARESTRGGRCVQWFRILAIKLARAMLAADQAGESDVAFVRLLSSLRKTGERFPAFSKRIPFKPKSGEPERFEIVPPDYKQVRVLEICPLEDWDSELQSLVNRHPSHSEEAWLVIFQRFYKAVENAEKCRRNVNRNRSRK